MFISAELKKFLRGHEILYTRGAPYHNQTQGKIERYHRKLKKVILLHKYFYPGELEHEISKFIKYYYSERYNEGINNMRPADAYFRKDKEIALLRSQTKKETLGCRKLQNLNY